MDDHVDAYLAKLQKVLGQVGEAEIASQAEKVGDMLEAWAMANPQQLSRASRRSSSLRGNPPGRQQKLPLWRRPVYMVSALVVAGVLIAIVLGRGGLNGERNPSLVHTYTTTAGQHATVTLADGSHAQLGPMTILAVTNHPAERQMNVHVTGEALFTVTHRPGSSFQVHAGNAVMRVLGTTFFVRRYATDHETRVVVAEGRVSLSGGRRHTAPILVARTLGTVDDSGRVVVTPNIAVEDYTAWTAGQLVFRNTPIRDIIAELSRAYDVEFRISDSLLADRHLNWTVPLARQSLTGVLAVLSGVLDAHPVRTGRIITFMPGQVASPRLPDLPSSTPERQYGK